jgi:hypothetical protein
MQLARKVLLPKLPFPELFEEVDCLFHVFRFSPSEWDVFVLDHVLNLFSHCDNKESNEVKEKDWIKYRNIQGSG